MLDVDGFKRINDTLGHDCGDRVLEELAVILRQALRKSDGVARWGGEEFLISREGRDVVSDCYGIRPGVESEENLKNGGLDAMKRTPHALLLAGGALVLAGWLAAALPAAAAEPIATGETNWDGIVIKVMSVVRKGNVLTVKFAAVNEGNSQQKVAFGFVGRDVCYVLDEESGTKYYVLTDKEGHPLAPGNEFLDSSKRGLARKVEPGKSVRVWMKFPAPPPEVKTISLFLNETDPIEDVPISER